MLNQVIFSTKYKNCNIFTPLINSSKKANIMKKNYLYLVLLLLTNLLAVGQKVTLTPITVNGANISTGPINLGSVNSSTVTLSVKVALKIAPNDSSPGTINIYQQKSASSPAFAPTGGNGGEMLFLGSTTAERSFNISLEFSNFDPSGGIIYAEYKTYSGTIYKSDPISVIRQSSSTGGSGIPADAPNPANISNTLCCNQTVRLGDKPAPIVGSQYANPYENYGYGINSSFSINSSLPFEIDKINKTLNFDYTTELKNITITRSLGYNSSTNLPNKSNTVTITVVPSPILSNKISISNIPENSEGYCEFSSLKSISIMGQTSFVDLNILNDPSHIYVRGDEISQVENYKWEYTKIDKNNPNGKKLWIAISNENLGSLNDFNPSLLDSKSEDNYYIIRRIVSYKNISRVSNEVKIMSRGMGNNNTICCDQNLKITSLTEFDSPQTIIGSTPIIQDSNITGTNLQITSISYQWQSQLIGRSTGSWLDISGAISKDYLPNSIKVVANNGGRGGQASFSLESNYNYRRITKINYTVFDNKWINGSLSSYSNEVSLTGSSDPESTKIYPNPTTSILNIENSTLDISQTKISIINIMGMVVSSNNFSIINPNLISINVSNLITGTYIIKIEYNGINIAQKTFVKN
ncbi:T9SS type A sorting domain-containing protein [Flavobacterium marginilacus]|uniref:T9SS type A sorting domain-containing protein n=1 Tax=Flavobacterium marginilacus TaxID=3003256 RepID=UPI00248DDF0C|nr:T9SS type A sorting domain-containing protein [Flavobacterium marginilacus]